MIAVATLRGGCAVCRLHRKEDCDVRPARASLERMLEDLVQVGRSYDEEME